jgi:hypothetical protein
VPDTLSSEIQLRTYIESESVPLNREVVYHIQLRWQGDLSLYKISEILEPTVTNLATRGSGSSNKVRTAHDGSLISVKEITFYFRAYIDGVTIKYTDQIKEKDESLISSRIGVKIIEPLPEPSENGLASNLFLGLVVLIVVGLALYLYFNYRKKQKEAAEKALLEIKETVLLDVLKEKELSEESLSRITDYYSKANLVKFAGEAVEDSEFHRLYDTVELVLDNQKNITTETSENNSENS